MPAFKDRIADTAYQLGWSVVCRLPERWAAGVFRWFADVAWRRQGPRVQTLEANLRRVLGPDADGKELRAVRLRAEHPAQVPLQRAHPRALPPPGHVGEPPEHPGGPPFRQPADN